MFRNMRIVILFDMFLNPSFKHILMKLVVILKLGLRNMSKRITILILMKFVVILKLGLRSISKRITILIFLNIYTPPQHALTHIILIVLK